MKIDTDIIVAGTGPAGLVAALALAAEGFSVALAGPPVAPSAGLGDRRTTALMKPSLDVLDRLRLLEAIRPQAAPLRAMRIVDATARLLRSPTVIFRAAEIGEEMFGMNIPNAHLNAALAAAVKETAAIRPLPALVARWTPRDEAIEAELADGTVVTAKLAAAADGRRSPAREAAGIAVKSWQAGQSALVLNFSHTRPHDDTSTEFHTEDGPFTQVPLPGLRSSLVWVTRRRRADELATLADATLSRMIEERMQSMLGRVTVEPGGANARQVFPLASALPARFAARRIALVGEAAHIFPPIGAQGLNLGIRDAEDLARVAAAHAADPGAKAALSAYDRARRPDILARSSAVDMLNRSLLSAKLPAQAARAAGLSLLRVAPPLRAFFMREGLRTGGGVASLLPWK
jgi:2-octaprenyl-6-methoxyphenol hydroxylase